MNMTVKKKESRIQNNFYVSDGVGTNCTLITQSVIMIY